MKRLLFLLPAVAGLAYLCLVLYAASGDAAQRVSALATRASGMRTSIGALRLHGLTFVLRDLQMTQEDGAVFCSIGRTTVRPRYLDLLRGRNSLQRLHLTGLALHLRKRGESWHIPRLPASDKPKKPLFISSLSVEGSVSVNGAGLPLAFSARDLNASTSPSSFRLSFSDPDGRPAVLAGTIAAGDSFSVTLDAPRYSLREIPQRGKLELQEAFLSASATLQGGKELLRGRGSLSFSGVRPAVPGARPVAARVVLAGCWRQREQRGTLEECVVTLGEAAARLAVSGEGGFSRDRRFTLRGSGEADLERLAELLPPLLLRGVRPAGKIALAEAAVSLQGKTVVGGEGKISLAGGKAERGGKLLLQRVAAGAAVQKRAAGWSARGSFSAESVLGAARVSESRFTALFSPGLKPLAAEIHRVRASVEGVPVTLSLRYRSAERFPLSADISGERVPLEKLAAYSAGKGIGLSQGLASVHARLEAAGRDRWSARYRAALADVAGSASGKGFTLRRATVSGVASPGNPVSAAGEFAAEGEFAGRSADASGSFGYRPGVVTLSGGSIATGALRGAFDTAKIVLPAGEKPAQLNMTGVSAQQGVWAARGYRVSGTFGKGGGGIAAAGEMGGGAVSVRGGRPYPLQARGTLSGGRGDVVLADDAGGTVKISTGPGKDGVLPFRMSAAVRGEGAGALLPAAAVLPEGGLLSADGEGELRSGTVSFRGKLGAKELVLRRDKGLLPPLSLETAASFDGNALRLADGSFSTGALHGSFAGEVKEAASRSRSGVISFAVAEGGISLLLESLRPLLPAGLQGSAGVASASGILHLRAEGSRVEGSLSVRDGEVRFPAQDLILSGMDGSIPLAASFGGSAGEQVRPKGFSRAAYENSLAALRALSPAAKPLSVRSIRNGTVEVGPLTLYLRPEEDRVELEKLELALFGGRIVGRGFVRPGSLLYGADLLVHDLSLRAVCDAFPPVKGYVSGRIDGVIGVRGTKGGVPAVTGFVDLWARETKREKMLVSRKFLQKLAGQKLKGIFFRDDRPYDRGELTAYLEKGYLTFSRLDIENVNLFGVKDLSVSVAPSQNRIALDHLLQSVKTAAQRGKKAGSGKAEEAPAAPETEFKWAD